MSETIAQNKVGNNAKFVSSKEFVIYLIAVFFYTNMSGMINEYRRAYMVEQLLFSEGAMAFFNAFTGIAGFVLSFLFAMILDNKKVKNGEKFKPIGLMAAIPCGIITVLFFYTPDFLAKNPTLLLVYFCFLALVQGACFFFGNTVNMVAVVMTPNSKEREKLLSFRGISSAVGNSAPLVIVMVMGLIIKAVNGEENIALNYLLSSILCGVVGTVTMLLGMSVVKERIVYKEEKKNPLKGLADIVKNKHVLVVLLSEFLKAFRGIATFMQPFIAAVMLGSASKTLLFALPIGVGTMVGMLVINFLLKKFNSRVLYIASGVYSVIINIIAFAVGTVSIRNPHLSWLNVIFIVCLFLTGIQFGASNLLPTMFQADILDDLELKTGNRLDASLPFVISIGSTISAAIAGVIAPLVLYGDNSIIQYQRGLVDGTVQPIDVKIKLLFFYTVVHGIMMLLAGIPFYFYKLTGKEKERMQTELHAHREKLAAQQSGQVTAQAGATVETQQDE